ncbi:MAG: XRE family transcriptional regulator [Polyangiaceae bacterium]|nr:XRE family transcriptional regulator [Polyangiaceae bacterium]
MAKAFKNLVAKMSPQAQKAVRERADAALLALNLQELRQHCTELTQEDVAALLDVTQAYVSKFERRGDMLLSTLYSYIRALGGDLEIRVHVPGQDEVRITQFEHLAKLVELSGEGAKRVTVISHIS